jgi:hypothetical protein
MRGIDMTSPSIQEQAGKVLGLAAGYVGARTVSIGLDHGMFAALADAGIDMRDVTDKLLRDGIDAFVVPMNKLLDGIESKREAIVTGRPETIDADLPAAGLDSHLAVEGGSRDGIGQKSLESRAYAGTR